MFFAAENIPPLQELTYHYNYTIGQVRDKNGEEKIKECLCGSSECCHRLY
jgi:euchromatic histone-lysine N-methyltransferase